MAVEYRIQNPKKRARNHPKLPSWAIRPLAEEAAIPQARKGRPSRYYGNIQDARKEHPYHGPKVKNTKLVDV